MEGKLIKQEKEYYALYNTEGIFISDVNGGSLANRLSLKNCQAIENGYDLDELAINHAEGNDNYITAENSFKVGVETILEILGDKKFSEEDMKKAMNKIVTATYSNKGDDIFDLFIEIHRKKYMDEYIQSLQQTEWDVTFNPEEKDSKGCLILKRL